MALFKSDQLVPNPGSSILVIGGCGGIGCALVQACVDLGCRVYVLDLPSSIASSSAVAGVTYLPFDLREAKSVSTAFDQLSAKSASFEHVVFASGYASDLSSLRDISVDTLDDVLDGNLRGIILAAKYVQKLVKKGSFVFLSSAIGQLGAPGYAPYSVSKAGINALLRVLSAELAPNIRVNGVSPGAVDTPFIRGGLGRSFDPNADNEEFRFDKDDYIRKIPLQRMALASDIVGPILFLMSNAASYVTGQVLHVNGGGFMRD